MSRLKQQFLVGAMFFLVGMLVLLRAYHPQFVSGKPVPVALNTAAATKVVSTSINYKRFSVNYVFDQAIQPDAYYRQFHAGFISGLQSYDGYLPSGLSFSLYRKENQTWAQICSDQSDGCLFYNLDQQKDLDSSNAADLGQSAAGYLIALASNSTRIRV